MGLQLIEKEGGEQNLWYIANILWKFRDPKNKTIKNLFFLNMELFWCFGADVVY